MRVTSGLAGQYFHALAGSAPIKNLALSAVRHFFVALVRRHAGWIHKSALPDLFILRSVTAIFPDPTDPLGRVAGEREQLPFFAFRIGTPRQADVHWRALAWGALPSHQSLREGPCEEF